MLRARREIVKAKVPGLPRRQHGPEFGWRTRNSEKRKERERTMGALPLKRPVASFTQTKGLKRGSDDGNTSEGPSRARRGATKGWRPLGGERRRDRGGRAAPGAGAQHCGCPDGRLAEGRPHGGSRGDAPPGPARGPETATATERLRAPRWPPVLEFLASHRASRRRPPTLRPSGRDELITPPASRAPLPQTALRGCSASRRPQEPRSPGPALSSPRGPAPLENTNEPALLGVWTSVVPGRAGRVNSPQ